MPADTLLHAALDAARLGGRVALAHWRTRLVAETKPDGSPVTEADRAAETAIRAWIAERFPEDAVLGEEFGETAGGSGRRWLIDPIDGTKAFVAGVPLWGSLVAVMEGDVVVAGAASFPAVDEHVAAAPGQGCWHGGTRCRVSDTDDLGRAVVCTTDLSGHGYAEERKRAGWDRVARHARVGRTWGDCYGYLLVATGRAEAMLDPVLNAWDSACLLPIVTEAGGAFTDWDGRVTGLGGSAVATNAALAEAVRALL